MQVNPPPQRDQRASTATAPVHADDHRSGPQTPAGAGDRNRASPLPAGSPIRGTPYGASLSFATTTHLWPPSDPPSRESRSATSRTGTARSIPGRALASSVLDSPYQGSRTGLPPPISTSVPGTPAFALRARPSRRQPRLPNRVPGQQTNSSQLPRLDHHTRWLRSATPPDKPDTNGAPRE